MNDNIVSFPDQHKAAMVCQDDKGTGVRCMGFKDDEATGKYLSAFIRNQGFAS
jgi:hypothetical protein